MTMDEDLLPEALGLYKLDENGEPVKCSTVEEWGEFMGDKDRIIKQTRFEGGTLVSTVFLGMDHSFGMVLYPDPCTPILWETAVFPKGDWIEETMLRFTTKARAIAAHDELVMEIQERLAPSKDEIE